MTVAIYWDFDNVHKSVAQYVVRGNPNETRELVDISSVMEFVQGLGPIAINRAYADWASMRAYRRSLHEAAVDTIQRFGIGSQGSKNGADIRLALDAIEDLSRFTHLSTVVIVSGDSDFISLAQRCRQLGRSVVGVGVEESCSPYFVKSCSEFRFYRTLVDHLRPRNEPGAESNGDLDEAWPLVQRAYSQLVGRAGEVEQNIGTVKAMMVRLEPSFDERLYGCRTFTEFLERLSGRGLELSGVGEPGVTTMRLVRREPAPEALSEVQALAFEYRGRLKAEKIELPLHDLGLFWLGVTTLYELFGQETGGRTTAEYVDALGEVLDSKGRPASKTFTGRVVIAALYRTGLAEHASTGPGNPTLRVESVAGLVDELLHVCWEVISADDSQVDEDAAQFALLGDDLDLVPSAVVDRWGSLLESRLDT